MLNWTPSMTQPRHGASGQAPGPGVDVQAHARVHPVAPLGSVGGDQLPASGAGRGLPPLTTTPNHRSRSLTAPLPSPRERFPLGLGRGYFYVRMIHHIFSLGKLDIGNNRCTILHRTRLPCIITNMQLWAPVPIFAAALCRRRSTSSAAGSSYGRIRHQGSMCSSWVTAPASAQPLLRRVANSTGSPWCWTI